MQTTNSPLTHLIQIIYEGHSFKMKVIATRQNAATFNDQGTNT